MKMKKTMIALLVLLAVTTTACGKGVELEPQDSQMKAIFELATMDCYYHNVAKYLKEDASGMLWWEKDRHFWVEYSGVPLPPAKIIPFMTFPFSVFILLFYCFSSITRRTASR